MASGDGARPYRDGDLLTRQQLQEVLSIGKQTLYNWIHRGLIPPPVKFGFRSRWRWKDVRQVVERMRPGLAPPNNRPGS